MNYQNSQQLTIQQAVSRARKAAKQGKPADAVVIYTAILQHQPDHPIAKKGLRKLQKLLLQNQSAETKTSSPSQNQINSLVNLHQSGQMTKTEQACRELLQTYPQSLIVINVLGLALHAQGEVKEATQAFNRVIQLKPDFPDAYNNLGYSLKTLGQLDEALKSCDKAIHLNPDFAEAYTNRGIILKEQGRFNEAVASYDKAIELKPDLAEAYINRSNVLKDLGQLHEAVASSDKAIELRPDYAVAYNNRGSALDDLGQLQEALRDYDKSIELNPNYAVAYCNRGCALASLGQLQEAVTSHDKAIELGPDLAEAYFNRGVALQELGQFQLAMTSYQKAVSINPNNGLFWSGYASALKGVKFGSYTDELNNQLFQLLEQPTIRPADVSKVVIRALHCHPVISRTIALSKSDRLTEDISHLAEQLSTVPLLLRIMELSAIADSDVEKMLTRIRKAMLHKATRGGSEDQGLSFFASLAIHCFTNEYVFFESEKEKQQIEILQENVKTILANEGKVSPAWIAVLGAYRPLYNFPWANALLKTEWPDDIKKVIVGQVDNVREEHDLLSTIPHFASIDDSISKLVRNQYEENPYPRWINTGLNDKPNTISQVLKSNKLDLNFETQQFSNKPEILVAGCGTGQHALSTASKFLNCNVLAIDLSLTSLSYAKRKTQELGAKNIEYMQGDILKLDQLEREFDIIECAGVLHHMDDPLAGWKILVRKLREGGVMKIGLYSEIARQSIANARREIAKKEYTSSPDDIRRYRESIMNIDAKSDPETSRFKNYIDFYTLSECRDLLFHVQEHRFTLLQVKEALNDLDLKFLGFELQQSWIRKQFSELYPEKDAAVSLLLWHQFELKNPETFNGMYQFWVQKT